MDGRFCLGRTARLVSLINVRQAGMDIPNFTETISHTGSKQVLRLLHQITKGWALREHIHIWLQSLLLIATLIQFGQCGPLAFLCRKMFFYLGSLRELQLHWQQQVTQGFMPQKIFLRGAVLTGVPFFSPKALIAVRDARPRDIVDPQLGYNFLALSLAQMADPNFSMNDYLSDKARPVGSTY